MTFGKGNSGSRIRIILKDILKKFSPDVRNKIYQTYLSTTYINDFGSPCEGGIELFFNDNLMWISGYPNKGFVKIAGLVNGIALKIDNEVKGDIIGHFFLYSDKQIH